MLDYRPHIIESKRKISLSGSNEIDDIHANTEDILSSYSNIDSANVFDTIENIKSSNIQTNEYRVSNTYISDVMDCDTHIDRIDKIHTEVSNLNDTMCEMLYGSKLSIEEIKAVNDSILSKLKIGFCDNNALYYLSKIMCIANDYIDCLDNTVRALLYSSLDIKSFSNSNNFLNDDINALNRLLIQSTNDLSDQLNIVNYISDNNVVNNYLIKIYNLMIDYCDVKSSDLASKHLVLCGINDDINETFIDIVRTMEYIKYQNELFVTSIDTKFNQIKNLYIK